MRTGVGASLVLGFVLVSSAASADDNDPSPPPAPRFRILDRHGEDARPVPPAVVGGAFFALRNRATPRQLRQPPAARPPSWMRPAFRPPRTRPSFAPPRAVRFH